MHLALPFATLALGVVGAQSKSCCKNNPSDPKWPTTSDWQSLNHSIDGTLLSTTPVASTCWPGNPFDSHVACNVSKSNWTSSIFHAALPESIGATIFANNSCLPPGVDGYLYSQGCRLGGLPSYIVNATTEAQVATAVRWAADRNIRVAVKGTGHDLSGRSSGAFALSIWTRHFRQLHRDTAWKVPGSNRSEDVFVIGSGLGWGDVLDEALRQGRIVTTGQDGSVGPGGYLQGGGHGPLASTYGLGAQQILQLTVVTTKGEVLIANDAQNQDIFWALRGGGPGQYGVVTEYVIKHFPTPSRVAFGSLSLVPITEAGVNASWNAVAALFNKLPGLMDVGVAGAMTLSSGATAQKFNPTLNHTTAGAVASQVFWAYNMTSVQLSDLISPAVSAMQVYGNNRTLSITFTPSEFANYSSFYKAISGSNTAGQGGISSSRLLGRDELVNISHSTLASYLRQSVLAQNATEGTYATIGMSGGPGVFNAPQERWGALIPSWRKAYLHMLVGGASGSVDDTTSPQALLKENAEWIEENKEKLWRQWAPDMGAYMNEANPYNSEFAKDFYGTNYERLMEVKRKYDPTESLYVLSGVGSEDWEYDLQSGKLCKKE